MVTAKQWWLKIEYAHIAALKRYKAEIPPGGGFLSQVPGPQTQAIILGNGNYLISSPGYLRFA